MPFIIPNKGNNTTGINAVTAKGIISVIHQMAISNAIASVYVTCGFPRFQVAEKNDEKKGDGGNDIPCNISEA